MAEVDGDHVGLCYIWSSRGWLGQRGPVQAALALIQAHQEQVTKNLWNDGWRSMYM